MRLRCSTARIKILGRCDKIFKRVLLDLHVVATHTLCLNGRLQDRFFDSGRGCHAPTLHATTGARQLNMRGLAICGTFSPVFADSHRSCGHICSGGRIASCGEAHPGTDSY